MHVAVERSPDAWPLQCAYVDWGHGWQFGDLRGFWGVWHAGLSQLRMKLGITPQREGVGTANTALVYHASKLLGLHEGDLPYAVCISSFHHLLCPSFLSLSERSQVNDLGLN
jgi:hypothetical protein